MERSEYIKKLIALRATPEYKAWESDYVSFIDRLAADTGVKYRERDTDELPTFSSSETSTGFLEGPGAVCGTIPSNGAGEE